MASHCTFCFNAFDTAIAEEGALTSTENAWHTASGRWTDDGSGDEWDGRSQTAAYKTLRLPSSLSFLLRQDHASFPHHSSVPVERLKTVSSVMAPSSSFGLLLTRLVLVACFCLLLSSIRASPRPNKAPAHTYEHLRNYFRCEECASRVCPEPRPDGCELVKELGVCSCCLVCARRDGDPCGIYTEPCGHGLKCSSADPASIEPLFYGEGRCRRSSAIGELTEDSILTD